MSKWLEIAEGCEKATGPDREIDCGMAVLLGWEKQYASGYGGFWVSPEKRMRIVPLWTASLDAITALIERELPGWRVESHTHDGPRNDAWARVEERPFRDDRLPIRGDAYAQTEDLARCAAFCRAMAAKTA